MREIVFTDDIPGCWSDPPGKTADYYLKQANIPDSKVISVSRSQGTAKGMGYDRIAVWVRD